MIVPKPETLDYLIDSQQMWLAEDQGKIVGSISYQLLWNDTLCFQFFRVDTDYHDKKVGEKLLRKIESVAKEQGRSQLIVCISKHNSLFAKLHEKFNFKRIGELLTEADNEIVYRKEIKWMSLNLCSIKPKVNQKKFEKN